MKRRQSNRRMKRRQEKEEKDKGGRGGERRGGSVKVRCFFFQCWDVNEKKKIELKRKVCFVFFFCLFPVPISVCGGTEIIN